MSGLDGDVFDDGPCGLLCATRNRRITAVNRTLARWLGYAPERLIGRRFTDFFSGGGRIHYETHVALLLEVNGEVAEWAASLVTADGSTMPVLITADRKSVGEGPVIRMAVLSAWERRSYERELLFERRRAEAERARAEVLAATLQSSLLPPLLSPPPWLEAAVHYHAAADDVSGDFYDLFPLSADRWGFFLGDVVGKGAEAAALTSLTRYTLRAGAAMNNDLVAMLQTLNIVLNQRRGGESPALTTVIVGTLQPNDRGVEVHLASGGHPPALWLGADGSAQEIATTGGQAVGIVEEPNFVATQIQLTPGDTLLLYTDGLTEARTGAGKDRFDDTGALLNFVRRRAPASPSEAIAALGELLDELDTGVEDDVALLALGAAKQSDRT
jgi:sigma-B regulation protein RsbU (phosphoserine phosphatase)